jgi:hypothetical protein
MYYNKLFNGDRPDYTEATVKHRQDHCGHGSVAACTCCTKAVFIFPIKQENVDHKSCWYEDLKIII